MDAPALLPFPLPSSLPILFPYHMHLITHHTPLPSPQPLTPPDSPPFHLPLLPLASSFHSTPLPPSPHILPSSSHHIPPHPLLFPCVSSEVIGSYLINQFPPIPDHLPLSFQFYFISHSSLPLSVLFSSSIRFLLTPLPSHSASLLLAQFS